MGFKYFMKRLGVEPVKPLPPLPESQEESEKKIERTPEMISKWKESLGDTKRLASKLSDEQRKEICLQLAQFHKVGEIVEYIDERYGIKLNPTAVSYYANHPSWKAVIERYRVDYGVQLSHIAIFHKRKRLERLEAQFNEVESTERVPRARRHEHRVILKEAREECRPFEEVTVNNVSNTNVLSIQLNSLDDAGLLKKRDELLKRIGGFNGKPTREANLSGRVREGKVTRSSELAIDPEWRPEAELPERLAELESSPERGEVA